MNTDKRTDRPFGTITVRLLLSGHPDVEHKYDLLDSMTEDEIDNILTEVINQISEAIEGRRPLAVLNHPRGLYSGKSILGFQLYAIGPEELQARVDLAHRKAGFSPDRFRT
jgi:hypothetical protein